MSLASSRDRRGHWGRTTMEEEEGGVGWSGGWVSSCPALSPFPQL